MASLVELEAKVAELKAEVAAAQARGDMEAVAAAAAAYTQLSVEIEEASVREAAAGSSKKAEREQTEANARTKAQAGEQVVLHVYDLAAGALPAANRAASLVGLGAYHGGIEVYGAEVYFTFDAGIVTCAPGGNTAHVYNSAAVLGETMLSRRKVKAVISQMRRDGWIADNYDLLNRNCLHFARAFVEALGLPGDAVPAKLNRLAGIGSKLDAAARAVAGTSLSFLRAATSFASSSAATSSGGYTPPEASG
ncbi:uncharacterized protein AMSG_02049 [Thecamonas trahens ATCC 50062]|uniref:PPPDE domain-containing protein n=1 Tax=Thecamonas trahens ATCC 50062 TaxID=461836 RepID=A0A0L0DV15_THETB|nr:hypothetical protein AMSG_02049 [Thecamonas trahens ATCC 50062]KNC56037.1 hypothetical protein AMSG_02049 [Thecamonas trahens ATCC 50062]|eukprot:XP_013761081.1 hypothetical protein AMSG_02049 [Thecamonas trahens ATCC 50062]